MSGAYLPAFLARTFAEAGTPHVIRFESWGGIAETFAAFASPVDAHRVANETHAAHEAQALGLGGVLRIFDATNGATSNVTWAARVGRSEPCSCDCSPCSEPARCLPGCACRVRALHPRDVAELSLETALGREVRK